MFDFQQACNSQAVTYVPLYDTLGMFSFFLFSSINLSVLITIIFTMCLWVHTPPPSGNQCTWIVDHLVELSKESDYVTLILLVTGPNAVEFIINHAEVSIAFVQENKISAVGSHPINFIFIFIVYKHYWSKLAINFWNLDDLIQ